MTALLKLPRLLTPSVKAGLVHQVGGSTLHEALEELFRVEPGVKSHLLDEQGNIRPHVSVFVDGQQATLRTPVRPSSEIRVLQAVSGG
jgi:molybdopterin synthase sulfur carrier subunit